MSRPREVAVIGGGITGLTAALALAQRSDGSVHATVYEAGAIAGGNARTAFEDGFLIEAGPNGFLENDASRTVLGWLGIEADALPANPASDRRFIVRAGRLREVPHGPMGLIFGDALSVPGRLRMMREPWIRSRSAPGESVYEFARRRIGEEAARVMVDAAVGGITAGDSRALEVASAFPKMVEMERDHGSLVRAMLARVRAARASGAPRAAKPRLVSFTRGVSQLVGAYQRRLGADVRLGRPVRSLARAAGGWRLEFADGPAAEADVVLVATQASGAAALLRPLDPALAETLAAVPFSGVGVVALAWREHDLPAPLDGYGFLIPAAEGGRTLGAVWESSLFAGRAPAGHVLIRAMIGGARDPHAIDESDAALIARARRRRALHASRGRAGARLGVARPRRHRPVHRRPRGAAGCRARRGFAASGARAVRHIVRRRLHGRRDGGRNPGGRGRPRHAARRARRAGTPPLERRGARLRRARTGRGIAARAGGAEERVNRCDVVLVTYGEPPRASFLSQLRYSWRILLGLTRSVAPIPPALLPMIALARARLRVKLWTEEAYASPLEPITLQQARALELALKTFAHGTSWHVHVAYEFRDPLLPRLLDSLPASSNVIVMPMYLADSAFTHELTRRCVLQWAERRGRSGVTVLPPLDEAAVAEASAAHILREMTAGGIAAGPDVALVLAAHGTLLEPPRPIETGRVATERIAALIEARLKARFGRVQLGWLNHVYGGKWTEPAADVALRDLEKQGFRRVVYYPFGFLADNAESQLEGRVALRAAPGISGAHLSCLNGEPELIAVMRDQVIAAAAAPAERSAARSA